jgi:16S rRNA G966 N2-methylase RsmD
VFHVGETFFVEHVESGLLSYHTIESLKGRQKELCKSVVPLVKTYLEDEALEGSLPDHCVREDHGIDLHTLFSAIPLVDGYLIPTTDLAYRCQAQGAGKFHSFVFQNRIHHAPPRPYRRNPTVLEIFAGVGGMSLGFKAARAKVNWLVEKDGLAASSLGRIHPAATVCQEDVNQFAEKTREKCEGYPIRGEIHHIHASPPCQGFSIANQSGGRNDEKNNDLSLVVLDLVRTLRPNTVTIENVTGMLRPKHAGYPTMIIAGLLQCGYSVRLMVLDSKDYGDPQRRNRAFFQGWRRGWPVPKWPAMVEPEERKSLRK